MAYVQGYRDTVVIPDKYSTGCKGELVSMADYFGSYYTEGATFYITSAIQTTFGTVYENIDFTDVVNLNKKSLQSMVFRNCRFSKDGAYNVGTGTNFESNDIEVVFENCEFLNAKSASVQPAPKMHMINCKIHDVGSDGGKVFDNGSYENCYFYNIGMTDGAHADGIQVTGYNENFSIINCRFDVPAYTGHVSNAALFFVLENDSYNSTVKDCVMNGGGYTMYYGRKYPDAETPVVIENNTVENILVGCSYNFGKLNDNSNSFNHEEVKEADKLFVSSVYKEDGNTKLLVTNYTNTQKTLKVVTNRGETEFVVEACPLYDGGLACTSISEFPFDVECVINEDVDYIVCYDADEQIRYVNFSETTTGITVAELFAQICNAIRQKDGTTELIKHLDIPQRILDLETESVTTPSLFDFDVSKTKTSYYAGETLTTDDITVTAIYTDGSTADVTSLATIDSSSVNMEQIGTYTISVTYVEGKLTVIDTISIKIVADASFDLPEQTYDYYGVFSGVTKEGTERHVYVTSATQKKMTSSAGYWKLTTNTGLAKVYESNNGTDWTESTEYNTGAAIGTINLYLASDGSDTSYTYEGNICSDI